MLKGYRFDPKEKARIMKAMKRKLLEVPTVGAKYLHNLFKEDEEFPDIPSYASFFNWRNVVKKEIEAEDLENRSTVEMETNGTGQFPKTYKEAIMKRLKELVEDDPEVNLSLFLRNLKRDQTIKVVPSLVTLIQWKKKMLLADSESIGGITSDEQYTPEEMNWRNIIISVLKSGDTSFRSAGGKVQPQKVIPLLKSRGCKNAPEKWLTRQMKDMDHNLRMGRKNEKTLEFWENKAGVNKISEEVEQEPKEEKPEGETALEIIMDELDLDFDERTLLRVGSQIKSCDQLSKFAVEDALRLPFFKKYGEEMLAKFREMMHSLGYYFKEARVETREVMEKAEQQIPPGTKFIKQTPRPTMKLSFEFPMNTPEDRVKMEKILSPLLKLGLKLNL